MIWTTPAVIRARREQIGLSQSDLAAQLGVTKSLLSLIESGKRGPTEEQLTILARVLELPAELLQLGTGRMPDDVRSAFLADAAGTVAAVRARTEARVVAAPQFPSHIPLPKAAAPTFSTVPLPERIDVRKNLTAYRAHSYHTKVPPEAITPFIRAYSNPGDTILDPFCGSGMTGVAALREGRNALLSDLSPAAVHIARNYTLPCDPAAFAASLHRVEQAVSSTMSWLYRPCGSDRTVEYTTWSDIFLCAHCAGRIVYWEVVQHAGGVTADPLTCPHCRRESRKTDLEWLGDVPVQSHTSAGSSRIDSHPVTAEELNLVASADASPIPYWTPTVAFGSDREMWRAAHRAMGITDVAGFFTRRNLHALAALRHAIVGHADGRVREALLFAFTAALNRASKRYQWNVKRPTNVMTGTLYVSSLRYEWNVWSLFRRKAADVLRYYTSFPPSSASVDVFQRSATDLDCLPDRSIDLVFMDPPFGSNIFYGDCSLLWESWLGQLTDESGEIVINKHRARTGGGKSLEDYRDLMQQSFAHAGRVLRPGGRAILAFSNSDDTVWASVQTALQQAGFETASVHLLNKGQPSIKGVKGVTGKENVTTFDLVLCLEHRRNVPVKASLAPPSSLIDQILRDCLRKGVSRTDEVYSAVVRAIIESHYSVTGITMPMIAERCAQLGGTERSGRWIAATPMSTLQPEPDYVAGYLSNPKSVPQSAGGRGTKTALAKIRVTGGRNTALYLAHSYHTKVPPEAIAPFIEHYTKPDDVILDPFCGSGMTGVAAALAGRRAILNDLSPAAVHLAWNHSRPCDPDELRKGFAAIETAIGARFRTLYKTTHTDGSEARIHWMLWSTRHRCPRCDHSFLLWEIMDKKTGRLGTTIDCPSCRKLLRRAELKKLGSEPAWIAYETKEGKRCEKAADAEDVRRAKSFKRSKISVWYPTTPLGADREMFIRCALQLQGIETVADFYTPRNLEALGLLWQAILRYPDERVRRGLAFAFTNTAWHGTRMRRFNARGGQRPLTGTLYIPQLSSEANVLEVMRNKIEQLQRYYRSYRPRSTEYPALLLGSATDLSHIPDNSIDYVFTDPPFGSNIFYADCNLIWESWLGRLTERSEEAVVNRSLAADNGGKSLEIYAGLMRSAFVEMARVLKPSGWATIVFHNTDGAIWQAIRQSAEEAGFTFHEAASLDRQQQSHKGYKGRSGTEDVAHFDVIFTLRKPSASVKKAAKVGARTPIPVDLPHLVASIALDHRIVKHGLQGVHAEVMRRMASNGHEAFVDYAAIRAIWEELTATRAATATTARTN